MLVFVARMYFCIGGAQRAEVTEQMSLQWHDFIKLSRVFYYLMSKSDFYKVWVT
jgi:hypothetical protein